METLLRNISGVIVYIDDILVTGATETDHLKSLEEVLRSAKKHKCTFFNPSMSYLGHYGTSPPPACRIRWRPFKIHRLRMSRSWTLLTYYGKFLPNLAINLAPLYKLLGQQVEWTWKSAQERAFVKTKQLLVSSQLLFHFDSKLPLMLACDASRGSWKAHCTHPQ